MATFGHMPDNKNGEGARGPGADDVEESRGLANAVAARSEE